MVSRTLARSVANGSRSAEEEVLGPLRRYSDLLLKPTSTMSYHSAGTVTCGNDSGSRTEASFSAGTADSAFGPSASETAGTLVAASSAGAGEAAPAPSSCVPCSNGKSFNKNSSSSPAIGSRAPSAAAGAAMGASRAHTIISARKRLLPLLIFILIPPFHQKQAAILHRILSTAAISFFQFQYNTL